MPVENMSCFIANGVFLDACTQDGMLWSVWMDSQMGLKNRG